MSSARDELATLAEEAHEDWCAENEERDPWGGASWEHVADMILAAGYRKEAGK